MRLGNYAHTGQKNTPRKGDTMTRKDYEAIASVLAEARKNFPNSDEAPRVIDEIGLRLAEHFIADNPRFAEHRFYDACRKG
jgi:hypothetical protein